MPQTTENNNQVFKPYVAAGETIAEVTVRAIVLGSILSVVFGIANAFVPVIIAASLADLSGIAWSLVIPTIILIAIASTFLGRC